MARPTKYALPATLPERHEPNIPIVRPESRLPLTDKHGSTINGSPIYYDEITRFQYGYSFLRAGQYLGDVAQAGSFNEAWKEVEAADKKLAARFDTVSLIEYPIFKPHDYEGDRLLVGCNWLDVRDGCWYHYIEECLTHPKDVREAIISGLWMIVNKLRFCTGEDFHAYEYIINDSEGWLEDRDETEKADAKKLVKFHKSQPVKNTLKWYGRSFHKHARTDTLLGDWLRLIWHYRQHPGNKRFIWGRYLPEQLNSEDNISPCTVYETRGVFYRNDVIAQHCRWDVDSTYNEAGFMGLADYEVYTTEKLWIKSDGLTKAQIANLSRDFKKLWEFNLKTLKYYFGHGKGNYDYKNRPLSGNGNPDSLRKRARKKQKRSNTHAGKQNVRRDRTRQAGTNRRFPAAGRRRRTRTRTVAR